jgi:tripartite ATP-independent transporter DctP family solute receptor
MKSDYGKSAFWFGWFALTLVLDLAGAEAAAGNYEFEEANYVLAHHFTPEQSTSIYADEFAKLVKEMTNGKVTIEVFGSSQIGNLKDNADALRYTSLDFALIDLPTLGTIVPKASIISLPYLFGGLEHVEKFYASPESDKLNQLIADTIGIKILGQSHVGQRVVIGQVPIRVPADLNNIKISSPDKPINVRTMKAFGANPTVVPFGETYTALQTGIVNASDLTPDSAYSVRVHEVCKYISGTDHIYVDVCLAMNNQLYLSFSPELRDVVKKASDISTGHHRTVTMDAYEVYMQKAISETMIQRIIPPDLALFRQAVQPVWEQFSSEVPDGGALIDYIRGIK